MNNVYLIRSYAVALLCGSAFSATILEDTRDVTIVAGRNDTALLQFTCTMTTSGRLHTKLEWTHNALAVPDCIDGVRLEAGTYCAEDRQNGVDMIKTTLRLGKATKGQSDGVYTCNQYWYPNNRKTLRYATNVSITVIEINKPTVSPGFTTAQGKRNFNHQSSASIMAVTDDISTTPSNETVKTRASSTSSNSGIVIGSAVTGVLIVGTLVSVVAALGCRHRKRVTLPDVGSHVISNNVQGNTFF